MEHPELNDEFLIQAVVTKNPLGNRWTENNTNATISLNGLKAYADQPTQVYALKGFPIAPHISRSDHYAGTIVYYFEVTELRSSSQNDDSDPADDDENKVFWVGLSNGNIQNDTVGECPNSYAFQRDTSWCKLWGESRRFGLQDIQWTGPGDILGCGILLSPSNNVSVFFTLNGTPLDQFLLNHPAAAADYLYPTVTMRNVSLEVNFGGNLADQFLYDIRTCHGLMISDE